MKPKFPALIRTIAPSFRPSLVTCVTVCCVAASLMAAPNSHAAIYYWNTTTPGTWATNTNWWTTDVGTANPASAPVAVDSVVFNGIGVDGDTIVQLDADAATTGITFNNTGTTAIQNFDATPRALTIGTGGITVGATAGNPTFSTGLTLSGNQSWTTNGGRTINIAGVVTGVGRTVNKGSGGTVLFTTGANADLGALDSSGSADLGLISVTDGTVGVTSLSLRRSAAFATAPTLASPVQASTNAGLYVNGASASVSLGTLNIGIANSSASARIDAGSVTASGAVTVGKHNNSTRWSILQVNGGSFTSSDSASGIVISQNTGTSYTNKAELYLSGGVTTAKRIAFGASTDTLGGNGFVILGGGTLYLDTPGIVLANTTGLYTYTIGLNSGTLGAKESWSSSLNMTLGTNPTIKAADISDVAKDISLSGNLTGGGFTKTGPGTLTIGGTATLTGTATGSAGTIVLPAGGSLSSNAIGGRGFWLDGGSLTTNAAVTSAFAGGASNAYLQSAGTANVGTFGTPNAGGELIKITGGGFTATAVSLNRTFGSNTTPTLASPLAAPTTSGFYVNGETAVANLGALYIGTGNSSSSARIDEGSVTVSGAINLGKKNAASSRWDVLQINGGSFTASDAVDGIVIGQNNGSNANNAELYLSGGTTTAARIAFGKDTDTVGGNGLVIMDGGDWYVGSGGIVLANTTGLYTYAIGLANGTLGAADHWSSPLNMTLSGDVTVRAADALAVSHEIELSGGLSGIGGLTKTGAGKLTLAGLCTYTGETIVNEGTLELATTGSLKFLPGGSGITNAISGSGTATLKGAFEIDLTGAVATVGNSWTLVDVATLGETFEPSFSVTDFTESANVWTKPDGVTGNIWKFEESTGVLSYVVAPAAGGFASWIDDFGLSLADQDSTDDPDNDGIENLLEFVLNGNPSVSDSSIMPDLIVNATDFEFTFNRRDDSLSPETTQTFQYSKDLVIWTNITVPTGSGSVGAANFTVTDNGITDSVKVSIPKTEAAPGTKLFGRLQVVK